MNEVKLIIRLAKIVRTPKQGAILLVCAGVVIGIAYVIPADAMD